MAKLFLEGNADENFLRQLITNFGLTVADFVILGGRDMANFEAVEDEFSRGLSREEKMLVVIDADYDWPSRETGLLKWLSSYGLMRDHVFVFPNDSSDGTLEDLLLDLVPEENWPILECLGVASKCVETTGARGMDKKDIVYQYVSSLLSKKEMALRSKHANEGKRPYSDPKIWNLNSESLDPLEAFLRKHLS
ncbi:MAG: hypothetical protein K9G41_09130 [Flavobacteriales bacterium]|nr:hypothetical protein [Flavobacteriales bacterium]